jgi:hypothetical protein
MVTSNHYITSVYVRQKIKQRVWFKAPVTAVFYIQSRRNFTLIIQCFVPELTTLSFLPGNTLSTNMPYYELA